MAQRRTARRPKGFGSLYRGREITGGNHGFLRSKTWRFAGFSGEGSGALLKYRITPEDFSRVQYPLRVGLDLTYMIELDTLNVLFEFQNNERDVTAHVAFGLHPGFGATSFESFHLQMPKGLYRR